MNKKLYQQISETEWWFVFVFFPLAYWLPLCIAGIKARIFIWVFFAILYLLPSVCYFFLSDQFLFFPDTSWILAIGWLPAFIHTVVIQEKFNKLMSAKEWTFKPTGNNPTSEIDDKIHQINKLAQIILQLKQTKQSEDIGNQVERYTNLSAQLENEHKTIVNKIRNESVNELSEGIMKLKTELMLSSDPKVQAKIREKLEVQEGLRNRLYKFVKHKKAIETRLDTIFIALVHLKAATEQREYLIINVPEVLNFWKQKKKQTLN